MALYEAHPLIVIVPQATLTFGQCALGLAQVKASGLVEVFDLMVPTFYRVSHTIYPHFLSGEPKKSPARGDRVFFCHALRSSWVAFVTQFIIDATK